MHCWLAPSDEVVLLAGTPPIRAKKVRYFEDRRLTSRVLPPPIREAGAESSNDDWTGRPILEAGLPRRQLASDADDLAAEGGIRREPALPDHEAIVVEAPQSSKEFVLVEDEEDADVVRAAVIRRQVRAARQAALDPDDGLSL